LDSNASSTNRNKLPALFLLHCLNLFVIIKQLNVSLCTGEFKKRRHDAWKIWKEVIAHDTAHASPAVKKVRSLWVIRVGDVLLYPGKRSHQASGVHTQTLLADSQSNQTGTLHSLCGQQPGILIFSSV